MIRRQFRLRNQNLIGKKCFRVNFLRLNFVKNFSGSSKSSHGDASGSGGITEEEVRRYLQRKPLSTTELVAKFKPRCQGMGKQEIVQCLADILKRLKPEQFRRKDTLYFSLKNS